MSDESQGELVPVQGGDPIPLSRDTLVIGRHPTSDICLPYPNISGRHCELIRERDGWYIRDLASTNGTRVNGLRTLGKKLLHPQDEITLARQRYTIRYRVAPEALRALEADEDPRDEIFGQSLLERAGLSSSRGRGHWNVPAPRERRHTNQN